MINNNGVETLYYGYTDNQGSLIALTNEAGTVVEKYAYDPWGDRRNPADWTQKDNGSNLIINRGYTGHEHLNQFGIINMNGRVYDPLTAMFFSPDPFIQTQGDWKNYNRYSYCMNNPTRYSDPSGYRFADQVEQPADIPEYLPFRNYGGNGGSSLKYWSDHQGKISWNSENERYEYASGAEATTDQAMKQLFDGAKDLPEDANNHIYRYSTEINSSEKSYYINGFKLNGVIYEFSKPIAYGGGNTYYSALNNFVNGGSSINDGNSNAPWMNVALSQLGVREATGRNDGPVVEKYLKTIGLGPGRTSYWCGAFINWTMIQAGLTRPSKPGWALSWRDYGQSLNNPAYGSIGTLMRPGGGHVGFVVAYDQDRPDWVIMLGGNQSDGVTFQSFPINRMQFNFPTGYVPSYDLPSMSGMPRGVRVQ